MFKRSFYGLNFYYTVIMAKNKLTIFSNIWNLWIYKINISLFRWPTILIIWVPHKRHRFKVLTYLVQALDLVCDGFFPLSYDSFFAAVVRLVVLYFWVSDYSTQGGGIVAVSAALGMTETLLCI